MISVCRRASLILNGVGKRNRDEHNGNSADSTHHRAAENGMAIDGLAS